MPQPAKPNLESPQELAWRRANPLLAELSTARIRELQASERAHKAAAARARKDAIALREWCERNMDELPLDQ